MLREKEKARYASGLSHLFPGRWPIKLFTTKNWATSHDSLRWWLKVNYSRSTTMRPIMLIDKPSAVK